MKYSVDPTRWDRNRILYKYRKAEHLKKMLADCTIILTRPDKFNDPFDTIKDVTFDFDVSSLPSAIAKEVERLVFSEDEPRFIRDDDLVSMIRELRANRRGIPQGVLPKFADALCAKNIDGLRKTMREDTANWKQFLLTWRISCLSELHDNMLMWAHYADSHQGGVIGFRCVPEFDSPFCQAFPVRYSERKPTLGTLEDWVKHITFQKSLAELEEVYMEMVFTKSNEWCYEKEWRYPQKALDKSSVYEARKFDEREVESVYLGCRMSDADRNEVIRLSMQFPNTRVYQAKQSKVDFSLEFDKIV